MTVSELRIGNWVAHDGLPFYIRDVEDLRDIERTLKHGTFTPIPLTEEWLLKFEFQKSNLAGYDQHFQYHHPKLNSPITALDNADFSMRLNDRARVLRHVHQLQNAFFVITGEELPLTSSPDIKTIEV